MDLLQQSFSSADLLLGTVLGNLIESARAQVVNSVLECRLEPIFGVVTQNYNRMCASGSALLDTLRASWRSEPRMMS